MSKSSPSKNKERISITIQPTLNLFLSTMSDSLGLSKSEVVEKALKELLKNRLIFEAKELSKMKFDDLPTEDEWLMLAPELEPYDKH